MKLWMTLFIIALSMTSQPALAATAIGIVDMQRLLKDSKAMQSITKQAEAEKTKREAEAKKKDKILSDEGKEIQKQRAVLAKDVFEERSKEFKEKIASIQNDLKQKSQALQNEYNKALAKLQKETMTIIHTIAEDKNLTVVIPKAQLLFAEDGLDITEDVLKQLNKKLPNVKLQFKG